MKCYIDNNSVVYFINDGDVGVTDERIYPVGCPYSVRLSDTKVFQLGAEESPGSFEIVAEYDLWPSLTALAEAIES